MKKITTKVKILFGAAIIACATVLGLFLCGERSVPPMPEGPVPIIVSMDIDTQNAFIAQVFWTEDESEKFNQKQSIRKPIPEGKTHFEMQMPTDTVYRFRFDFGTNPGKVSVSNLKVSGLDTAVLDFQKFVFSSDVEEHELADGVLTITSTLIDPYMVYKSPLNIFAD